MEEQGTGNEEQGIVEGTGNTEQGTGEEEEERSEETIARQQGRILELEEMVGRLEGELAEQAQTIRFYEEEVAQREKRIAELKGHLEQAVARYRGQLLAQTPEVPEELVKGETVAEVDASLTAAQKLVERVRRQLEAKLSAERVPPGAPARSRPDLSALSPKDKIAYALARPS